MSREKERSEKTQKVEITTLNNLLSYSEELFHMSPESIDYQVITEGMKELSDAWIVGLNTYEKGGSKSITRAFSGISSAIKQASKIIGEPLIGKEWDINPERITRLQGGKLVHFSSLHETSLGAISKNTSRILERIFNIGDIYVIELAYGERESLGDLIFFMKKGKEIANREAIEVYAGLIGSILMRLRTEKALRESENKFRTYTEKAPVGIFVTDNTGRYIEVNRAACQMSGYTEEELLNLTVADFLAPEFLDEGMKMFAKVLAEDYAEADVMVRKKNGETFWIHLIAVAIDSSRFMAFCQDITRRKQAEEALQASEKRYRLLVNNANEAIVIAQDDMHKFVNPKAVEFFGYSEEVLTSTPFLEFIHPEDKELVSEHYQERIKQEIPEERYSFRIIAGDGSIKWAEISSTSVDWEGRPATLALINDTTKRKQMEEKIRYLSFHDHLTGLYNRHFLENEMERLDTPRQLPIGIIMADLNGLKLLNDTFGHEVGDEMLKQAAAVLNQSCRSEDIIARWGGDEFVIFLPQTTAEDVHTICQRINEKCQETFVEEMPLSLALGAANKHTTEEMLDKVLKKAEENMYKQKLAGRQRIKSAVLKTLFKNLAAKSFETEAHYAGMQSVAQKIGEKIGLSAAELNRLEMLITMHDIGKINIPKEILTKKGTLSAEEWEQIKQHPETGYRIAHATEEYAHVAEDISTHHERWDGSGYPQGLQGEEIPLLARITALAEAYEVMSSGRPYKKAMSREEIVAELQRGAGGQFDPELADVLLAILKEEP